VAEDGRLPSSSNQVETATPHLCFKRYGRRKLSNVTKASANDSAVFRCVGLKDLLYPCVQNGNSRAERRVRIQEA
jgi:hypothetical protein